MFAASLTRPGREGHNGETGLGGRGHDEKSSFARRDGFGDDKLPSNFTGFGKRPTVPSAMRKWVKFDKSGETTIMQADKHALTHQLGVQVIVLDTGPPQAFYALTSLLIKLRGPGAILMKCKSPPIL